MKQNFRRTPWLGMRMFFLLVLSLLMIGLDHRYNAFRWPRDILSVVLSPIHYVVDRPVQFIHRIRTLFVAKQTLIQENDQLKAQQLLLSLKLQKILSLERENEQLKFLLHASNQIEGRVLAAQVVSVATVPYSEQIVLNKGYNQNVFVGQAIFDQKGILGQVVSVLPNSSRVLLITDSLSAIPVEVNRNGQRGIATGMGRFGYLHLLHIVDTADIKEGDTLVTSGLGQRFPRGYPVGMVVKVESLKNKHLLNVLIKPASDINKTRHVLLLWPNKKAS